MKFLLGQCLMSVILGAVFISAFAAYRMFFGGSIIFFDGAYFGIVSLGVGAALCLTVQSYRKSGSLCQIVCASLLPAFLFYFLFVSLVPTIIDRSVSITVLGKLAKQGEQGASVDELQKHFTALYVDNGKAVKVRIHEQISAGNIELAGDRYKITKKGEGVVSALKAIGEWFNIDMLYIKAGEDPY